jgi:VanZ family protein
MPVRRYRIALALHLSIICAISAWAYLGRLKLPPIEHIDLLGHFLLYGVLGALAHGALMGRTFHRVPLGPLIVLTAAGLEELLQGLSPYRHMSLLDFLADVIGVTVCVAILGRVPAWAPIAAPAA